MRTFFEGDTAFISRELAVPGGAHTGPVLALAERLSRVLVLLLGVGAPDFVNVETTPDGRSTGDNWLQKERTGTYVPDDYLDERLLLYDDLMGDWERWLRFQVRGRDANDVRRHGGIGSVMTPVPVATPTRRESVQSTRRGTATPTRS